MPVENNTGWVACDYTQGDKLADVRHGEIRATWDEATDDWRLNHYEGVRYVAEDGYLYVEASE